MSRSNRPPMKANRRKVTVRELLVKARREAKRRMIADGVMSDPALAPPKYDWHWGVRNKGGIVSANTKGEARAKIKQALGLRKKDKLSSVIQIVRVDRDANQPAGTVPCSISPYEG